MPQERVVAFVFHVVGWWVVLGCREVGLVVRLCGLFVGVGFGVVGACRGLREAGRARRARSLRALDP